MIMSWFWLFVDTAIYHEINLILHKWNFINVAPRLLKWYLSYDIVKIRKKQNRTLVHSTYRPFLTCQISLQNEILQNGNCKTKRPQFWWLNNLTIMLFCLNPRWYTKQTICNCITNLATLRIFTIFVFWAKCYGTVLVVFW